MSEYEYADLFASFLSAQNTLFANYMTMVFAMLAASWFLAARLTWRMTGIFLFIYTIWSLNLIAALYGAFGDFSRLGMKINELGQEPGSSLDWLGPADQAGIGYISTLPVQVVSLCLIVYASSLVFFFIVRKNKDRTLPAA